jgi:hypothetical protein
MGDFGSATEAMLDLFALQVFAKNLGRCKFRLLQHYRPESDVTVEQLAAKQEPMAERYHRRYLTLGLPEHSSSADRADTACC